MGRLGTPEGVTVIAGAVMDDVLGILVLTIVVGMAAAESVTAGSIVMVGVKAIGFWIGLTGGGLILAGLIARFIGVLRTAGAALGVVLGLAFLAAAVAEQMGLAMIIGAYSMGLALSRTALSRRLEEPLRAVYHVFVPVFFVVMGMLVDVPGMLGVLGFGAVIAVVAIISKLVGSGVPALFGGFNLRGAIRIGAGMAPRGEVALIIAGIGLTRGVVDSELFGVSVIMTAAAAILGPLMLMYLFSRGGSGRRVRPKEEANGEQV
jgi:Kef-type K+ transport system membrane component KefB